MIARYGDAIEYDLAVRGIDLAREWRSRRWRRLLNLIDHLPRDSAYVEALSDDEEMAERMLGQADRAPRRRMSEFSVEVELLSVIADRQAEIINALIARRGVKPARIKWQPRPETALERVRRRKRRRQHEALVAKVLPARAQQAEPAVGPDAGDETVSAGSGWQH